MKEIEPTEKDLLQILMTTKRVEDAWSAASLLRKHFDWDNADIYTALYDSGNFPRSTS